MGRNTGARGNVLRIRRPGQFDCGTQLLDCPKVRRHNLYAMDALLDVTRTIYKVSDFLSWQRGGNLDLRPPFQRNSVWSAKAKSFFIDSVFRGFPVPLLFIQDSTHPTTFESKRLVVDGQQRLRTLLAFVDPRSLTDATAEDDFSVLKLHNSELAGKQFGDLHPTQQQRILNFQFSVHVLPSNTPGATLLEIFARMNATGTKLNQQELRNAEFAGVFKQVSYELSYSQFERWIRWGIFEKTQMSRMLDVELTSELLILLLDGQRSKSQAFIKKTYRDFDDELPQEKAMRKRFAAVFGLLADLYGHGGIGRTGGTDAMNAFRRQSWFYTMFAFVHDLLYVDYLRESGKRSAPAKSVDVARLVAHVERRAGKLADETDLELLKALRGASTDKRSRAQRYQFLKRGWRDAH